MRNINRYSPNVFNISREKNNILREFYKTIIKYKKIFKKKYYYRKNIHRFF